MFLGRLLLGTLAVEMENQFLFAQVVHVVGVSREASSRRSFWTARKMHCLAALSRRFSAREISLIERFSRWRRTKAARSRGQHFHRSIEPLANLRAQGSTIWTWGLRRRGDQRVDIHPFLRVSGLYLARAFSQKADRTIHCNAMQPR